MIFRKRTPKPPTQSKERKKPEKRKPQAATVSDESDEELESEVGHYTVVHLPVNWYSLFLLEKLNKQGSEFSQRALKELYLIQMPLNCLVIG